MLAAKIDLSRVIVVRDTHLHRDLTNKAVDGVGEFSTAGSKAELLKLIRETEFDVLVSNGCPFILPLSELPSAQYVNIHPSCLPDLKGVDPVIGSVLFARDSGATCHVMDDGIDTGPIISQVRIPYTDDLDVSTLYQLSFIAEQQAFEEALARDFSPQSAQVPQPDDIYFSRSPSDREITFDEPNDVILRKLKAFNNRSQGCEFVVNGARHKVYRGAVMRNAFLISAMERHQDGVVGFSYENSILFRKDGDVLRLMDIVSDEGKAISVGDRLFRR